MVPLRMATRSLPPLERSRKGMIGGGMMALQVMVSSPGVGDGKQPANASWLIAKPSSAATVESSNRRLAKRIDAPRRNRDTDTSREECRSFDRSVLRLKCLETVTEKT